MSDQRVTFCNPFEVLPWQRTRTQVVFDQYLEELNRPRGARQLPVEVRSQAETQRVSREWRLANNGAKVHDRIRGETPVGWSQLVFGPLDVASVAEAPVIESFVIEPASGIPL